MSLPIQSAGKPITATDAQEYIEMFNKLKKCLKEDVLGKITLGEIKASQTMKDTNTLFDSDTNAFIFDKKTVMRFFEPEDLKGPKAEYLMVIMGAKYLDGAEKGNPTIVIAGVNDHPAKAGTYLSLNIPEPGTEQPPSQTIATFPGINPETGFAQIEFKML